MTHSFGNNRIGGSLCLDFVNTVGGRIRRAGRRRAKGSADQVVDDRLPSYEALRRWGALVGVLTPRQAKSLADEAVRRPAAAAAVSTRSLILREAMYRIFTAAIQGDPPRAEDLAIFNRELQTARGRELVVASPDLRWEFDRTKGALDQVLWPVVASAAELLTSASLKRVGQCPGDACGWLFLDTSRSRRRQWCDMAACGTLAKVRRFRQKQPHSQARHSNDRAHVARVPSPSRGLLTGGGKGSRQRR